MSFSNPQVAKLISDAFVPVRFSMHLTGPGSDDAGRNFVLENRDSETHPIHPPELFVINHEQEILGRLPFDATDVETLALLRSILDANSKFAPEVDPLETFVYDPNDPAQMTLASLETRWENGERASMTASISKWLDDHGDDWPHGDAVARTMLGAALYHSGDFDHADDVWSEVVERHPDHPLRHRAAHNQLDQYGWVMKHHPDIRDARHPKFGERRIIDPFPAVRIRNHELVFASSDYRLSPSGIPFALVPAGSFTMGGDPAKFDRELPLRRVVISKDFWVSAWPVTLGDWRKFRADDVIDSDDGRVNLLPVQNAAFKEAEAYCDLISKADGITYRLLTEAEWEYAARGNIEGAEYPWGNEIPDETKCNYLYPQGVPVASYPPNGYGLFDMAGNCREWTSDRYLENAYKLTPREVVDPKGPTVSDGWFEYHKGNRSVRGGYIGVEYSKVLARNANRIATSHAGFRLVAELP